MKRLSCWAKVGVFALSVAAACKRGKGADDKDGAAPDSSAAGIATGPTVTVPGGKLIAGSVCGVTPRITNEELPGDAINLNDFTIDVFPYPNDPGKPARVDVTRDEAASLCAASGKRLCTELEWERACKGPSNTMFEYGNAFNQANCKPEALLLVDKRPKCVSAFGVKDMHGLVFEWTSSSWGRATSGDLATVRGGHGSAITLRTRCANGQGRAPAGKAKDVGFRCCSGPANPGGVNLALHKQPPIVEEPAVDAALGAAMLKAMPPDHRALRGIEVAFDKVWRWHPRDNEEMLIGRWAARPKDDKPPFFELAVFKACTATPNLVARMRGPVAQLANPGVGGDAEKATANVQTEDDKGEVKLTYWYGTVQIDQPGFVRVGNTLATERKGAVVVRPPARKATPSPKPARR
jgi:hypothetical protein